MKIDIFTLFPSMYTPLDESIIKRARDKGLVSIDIHDIRSYAQDPHLADDEVYGGGSGMVLKPEPILKALEENGFRKGDKVIVTTPAGKIFDQREAMALAGEERIFIIAGHYEGVDQRVTDLTDAVEYSIGDYVLTGGELPSMVITDSVVRLLDGVLGDAASLSEESFNEGLLEQPQYTRPREFRGLSVPDVLLCGDHKVIAQWRRSESLKRTWLNRPDLLRQLPLSQEDKNILRPLKNESRSRGNIYVALVHYPVLDPKGHTIATSVTNLDIHDIARLSATYGVKGYFIIQPGQEQQNLVRHLIDYWTKGHGSKMNPDRKYALDKVEITSSLAEAAAMIKEISGQEPLTVGTSAKLRPKVIDYAVLSDKIERDDRDYLLIFGTGHGLTDEILDKADYVLKPIEGRGNYNHLSVRSAVSIVLDRLIKE